MDTLEIAVLAGFCLKIALAVVALVVVFKMKLPSSRDTKELQSEGDQQEESALEEKPKSRPVAKTSSRRGIHKRAVSSGKRPLKPKPAANEARKQAQTKNPAPVKSAQPQIALKNEPVKLPRPSGVSQGQPALTKPKSGGKPVQEPTAGNTREGEGKRMNVITTPSKSNKTGERIELTKVSKQAQTKNAVPVKNAEPRVGLKNESVKHTAFVGPPQPQAAFTVSRSGGKPPSEALADNTGGVKSNEVLTNAELAASREKREASMDKGADTEVNKASSEPSAATTDSGETDKETPQTEKSGLGDLADLFATSATDFTEKSKLAEQVKEVDVNDILSEGLGLLGKAKKSKD
jgi:hypothetical protein